MTAATRPPGDPELVTPGNRSADAHSRRSILIWLGIALALCLWTANRLGAFDLQRTVAAAGELVQQPNTFSSIDNPFHAARAALLLDTLRNGEFLRWVANHQGGYPAEFYPLGVAWIEVAVWALLLGQVPILAAHTLTVILIFLLPVVGFWVLARTDGLTPGVAVLALAGQVAIPGGLGLTYWTSGGYTELVLWGLVANVAGATFALIGFALLVRVALHGDHGSTRWAMLGAVAAITLSTYSNQRSLAGVVVGAVAIALGLIWMKRAQCRDALLRVAAVGGITALLCMPILLSLLRYEHLYIFLHYQSYATLRDYLTTSARTVSPPILVLAAFGAVVSLLDRRFPAARMTALALIGYALVTGFLSLNTGLIAQLETPRLMPFQRFLTLYLAAWAVWWLLDRLWSRVGGQGGGWRIDGMLGLIGGIMLLICLLPWSAVPALYRGLPPVPTTGNAAYADFAQVVAEADRLTPDGQAMLVLGTVAGEPLDLGGAAISWDWHGQLLAPVETRAPLLYNDWLWDWHRGHAGTPGYSFDTGHYYPDPANALEASYLRAHGIGTVVVTSIATQQLVPGVPNPDPREAARTNPDLAFVRTVGAWDIYTVRQSTSLVTDGNTNPGSVAVSNGRIEATFDEGNGQIIVRQNWFPRWTATVNGEPATVTRAEDGTMSIAAPAGPAHLVLVYGVTGWDWLGRICAGVGLILSLAVGAGFWSRLVRGMHGRGDAG